MTISVNLHRPSDITLYELYPDKPGNTINLQFSTDYNTVNIFLNDESLKQLITAARRYAETRSKTIVVDMVSELFGTDNVEASDDLPF